MGSGLDYLLSGSRLRTPGVSPGVKASSRRLARFSFLTLVLGVAFDFEVKGDVGAFVALSKRGPGRFFGVDKIPLSTIIRRAPVL